MNPDLPSTPEGALIRRARNRLIPKLSIPAAAAKIGISAEHWGNVERGRKSGRPPRKVEASPSLLAKMAAVVGVTAGQMRDTGERPDAADEMEAPAASRARAHAPQAGPAGMSPGLEFARKMPPEILAATRADPLPRDGVEFQYMTLADPEVSYEERVILVALRRWALIDPEAARAAAGEPAARLGLA